MRVKPGGDHVALLRELEAHRGLGICGGIVDLNVRKWFVRTVS
jgi:hypothetical protein